MGGMLFFCVLAIILWIVMLYVFLRAIFFDLNELKKINELLLINKKNTNNNFIFYDIFKGVGVLDVMFIFLAVVISFFIILLLLLLTINS